MPVKLFITGIMIQVYNVIAAISNVVVSMTRAKIKACFHLIGKSLQIFSLFYLIFFNHFVCRRQFVMKKMVGEDPILLSSVVRRSTNMWRKCSLCRNNLLLLKVRRLYTHISSFCLLVVFYFYSYNLAIIVARCILFASI